MASFDLLSKFIDHRTREHVEPSKQGTPKGEPVGFSKAKYRATLLSALTALREKEIAKELKLSYGLLRKWHVEPEFQQQMSRHVRDFAEYFWKAIRTNPESTMSGYVQNRRRKLSPVSFQDAYRYRTGLALKLCADAEQIAYDAEKAAATEHNGAFPAFYAFEIWRCLPVLRMAVGSDAPEPGRPKSFPVATTDSGAKPKNSNIKKSTATNTADEIRLGFLRASQALEAAITETIFELLSQPEGSEQRLVASALRELLRQEREQRRSMQILV